VEGRIRPVFPVRAHTLSWGEANWLWT
jgi:hypothetical protein